MLIRLKRSIPGSRNGQPWPRPGGTIVLPEREARDLIRLQYAEPVEESTVELAIIDAATEKTVAKKPRRRARGSH